MTSPIIDVRALGKRYQIRHQVDAPRYVALRDVLAARLRTPFRRRTDITEQFWALRDVSFSVQQGEVVGVIGRNGAGKSTLLKVLSRITEPTEGRITLDGRVASLLEVGTGFHPELTGRENVFLNGAILGMPRQEIAAKFDEIVAFAEIERFIDTPVKRYSSGMYMRLAFAVAAHLEPEILVVDEVLAVGDTEFQKKCLGRMDQAAKSGRTLLFVSHNLAAIEAICSRCIVLREGRVVFDGPAADAIAAYSRDLPSPTLDYVWPEHEQPGDGYVTLRAIRVRQSNPGHAIRSAEPFEIELDVLVHRVVPGLCIGFELYNETGLSMFRSHHTDAAESDWPPVTVGPNRLVCRIDPGWLNTGLYGVAPRISTHAKTWHVFLPVMLTFLLERTHGVSPFWTSLSDGHRPGLLAPIFRWASFR